MVLANLDISSYFNKLHERKEPCFCVFNEDIVRTSTLDDPYDDGYQDPNLDFKG